jgi:hypothetical protein
VNILEAIGAAALQVTVYLRPTGEAVKVDGITQEEDGTYRVLVTSPWTVAWVPVRDLCERPECVPAGRASVPEPEEVGAQ